MRGQLIFSLAKGGEAFQRLVPLLGTCRALFQFTVIKAKGEGKRNEETRLGQSKKNLKKKKKQHRPQLSRLSRMFV